MNQNTHLQPSRMLRELSKLPAGIFLAILFLYATDSRAASGVWINDASSVWSAGTNWLGGTIADGSGNTADFTLNNTNVDTVTLDSSRTLGALQFGNNVSAGTNQWILNASGNSVLTLAGGTSSIAVSNGVATNTAVAALPIAGASGLTKIGNGTLMLAGTNGYSGATTVSGGTLKLTNTLAGSSTTDPVLYMSFDNVSGPTVFNQGTGGAAMNGALTGGATIVPGGRYGSALSIPSSSAYGSYVFINNAVVPLNGSAGNNWTIAMWVNTTTAGGVYAYQGSGGWVSANTEFYLENGTQGDGAGTHQGGVRNSQSWVSGTATVNDGNWHFLVMTCTNAVRTMYFDGALDATLSGAGSWGGAGAGNQVRIGGAAAGADSNIGLNGLIDEVYMYNRALSPAEVTSLMNASSGPTDIASALPRNTAVSLAASGKLDLNGSTPFIGALTGTGTVDNSLASGTPALVVNPSSDIVFDGLITNTAGTLSLTKEGAAKMTLTGTNVYNGGTTVDGGTLNITGALEPVNPAAATMTIRSGVVNFSGTYLTNFNYNIGTTTNQTAALYQTSGILKQSQGGNGLNFQLGSTLYGYGYYYIGAGATNFCNEIGVGGEGNPAGNGMVEVNGGTIIDAGYIVVCRGGNLQTPGVPEFAVFNVYPGSLVAYANANGQQFALNWGTGGGTQFSVVNIMGGVVTNTFANDTFNLNQSGNVANTGILNLNGGVLQAGWVSGGANGTRVNFNGGTLLACENQAVMMQGLAAATVYGGGGTFNNAGFTTTINQQFLAPTGNGVNGISSFTGGAGYIAPPFVTVVNDPSDGSGVGATAIAQINPASGVVTNVLITCPGVNYTATPTFVLSGGNPTTPATITGAAPTPNVGGGMTFSGSGTTILGGGYTYTGSTVIAGGVVNLNPSTVTPSVAGNLAINTGTVNLPSTNGATLSVGNLSFVTSGSLNIAYGTVFANPTVAAVTASGGLTFAPTNIINLTGFGLKPGTFTVIKYTTGTISTTDFANIGYTLPPGLAATLVNNTANHSIDLHITSSPNQLSWTGVGGTNWDLTTFNWINNANSAASLYQQYVQSGVSAGDGVTFNDTLTNDFVNPQPTNINLTAVFTPFPVTVDSTLAYSIGGAGSIAGIGNVVKNNTGSLTLLTPNSFSGGLVINAGSVIVTNDSALGTNNGIVTLNSGTLQVNGNTTNNSRVLSVPTTSTIDIAPNVVARFGGTVSGAGGLTKVDDGTLTLAGNNSITGTLTARQGTLITAGNNVLPAVVHVADTAGVNGVLNVAGGTFGANNNGGQFTSSLTIGSVAGAAGDVQLTGGTLANLQQFGLGTGAGGYAGFTMTGGTLASGSYIVVGFNSDQAVFNQTGGAVTISSNLMTIAAGGTAAVGVANISGGTFTSVFPTSSGILVGERGLGNLNVSGTASIIVTNGTGMTVGPTANQTGWSGTLNANGGTITANRIVKGVGTGTGRVNFNGGTIKGSTANATFLSGLDSAVVYNNGLTIDDGGNALGIPQPLLGATGFGVATIPVVPGTSSGYIDTPIITVQGGSGSNAMATATVSGGQITAITVTCPGSGYVNGDSVSLFFQGGGVSAVSPQLGTITFVANGTGGLTKRGAGSVTITGVNTFTGPITNNAGTLSLNSASTYPAPVVVNAGTVSATTASTLSGGAIVTNGATLTITQLGSATNSMGNLTLNGGNATPGAILGVGLTGLTPTVPLINCGVLTFNGTNTISVSGAVTVGAIPLIKYTSLAGSGTFTNLTLPQGAVGVISNSITDSTIYVVISSTGPGLVWSGTNSVPALTNLWDIGSTTNWLLGATATAYRQPIIPGDAVTFNDSGSGTVIVNTNVGPSSLVISNNSKGYVFGGRGNVTGPGGITKLGTGTAILNLTNNNYAGDTTISNGTLQVGSATAVSSAANLNLGSTGTLELNGFSETVNGLFGQGVVDNNNTTNVALTVNTGGVWNGFIRDQGLGGGVSLTKVGNSTLVIGGTNSLNSTTASQVNAGLAIITNNGVVNLAVSEYWVGSVAGSTATNIVDGGRLSVSNNFLVVGRGNANANGTLILNSGTIQKAGANVVVVGSLGAVGTLIVNGGQFLNNSELWLGENATAVANLYLNGGTLQATDIRPNGTTPTVPPTAYFNGGTLQASGASADFLQVTSQVMSNGLIFDDGGFSVAIVSAPLLQGDAFNGGLIKKGAGALYLDAGNTYIGTTIVTNGTLAGVGSVGGDLAVGPAGNIGGGDATVLGQFLISGNLDLRGKATFRLDKTGGGSANDQVAAFGDINFGGVLVVSNVTTDGTPLTTSDSFRLFNSGGNGNFTSISGSPGPGLVYNFNPANGKLTVISNPIAPNPTNITFSVSGGNLALSWPADHLGWILQSETNNLLTAGWFDVPGTDTATNANITISPTDKALFFRLRHP